MPNEDYFFLRFWNNLPNHVIGCADWRQYNRREGLFNHISRLDNVKFVLNRGVHGHCVCLHFLSWKKNTSFTSGLLLYEIIFHDHSDRNRVLLHSSLAVQDHSRVDVPNRTIVGFVFNFNFTTLWYKRIFHCLKNIIGYISG